MIYTNTIPNNKIISNLNKSKTFVNYWSMLKRKEKNIYKNIGAW